MAGDLHAGSVDEVQRAGLLDGDGEGDDGEFGAGGPRDAVGEGFERGEGRGLDHLVGGCQWVEYRGPFTVVVETGRETLWSCVPRNSA